MNRSSLLSNFSNKQKSCFWVSLFLVIFLFNIPLPVFAWGTKYYGPDQLTDAQYRALTGGRDYKIVGDETNLGFYNNLPISIDGKGLCPEESSVGNLYALKAQETEAVKTHNTEVQKVVDKITTMGEDLRSQRDSLNDAFTFLLRGDLRINNFKSRISSNIKAINEIEKIISRTTDSNVLKQHNERLDKLNFNLSSLIEEMKSFRSMDNSRTRIEGAVLIPDRSWGGLLKKLGIAEKRENNKFSTKSMTWGEADAIINKYVDADAIDMFSVDLLKEKGVGIIDEKKELAGEKIREFDKAIRENASQWSMAEAEMQKLPSHRVTTKEAEKIAKTVRGKQKGFVWKEGNDKPTQVANCVTEEEAQKRGWKKVTAGNIDKFNAQSSSRPQRTRLDKYFAGLKDADKKYRQGDITRAERDEMKEQIWRWFHQ